MEALKNILENIQGGIVQCNFDTVTKAAEVRYINRGWTDITGYTTEQLKAEKDGNPQTLIFSEDKEEAHSEYMRQLRVGNTYELLYRIVHRGGELRWVIDKGITSTLPDGRMQNESILTEVTAIKKREAQMAFLAQIDQLTGLNNKATFTYLAKSALNRPVENRCALLMIDIDSFKGINDTYGHDFGDKVLTAVAEQMKSLFRSGDVLGRVGGDEFMALMTSVTDEQAVFKKTRELCSAIGGIKIPVHTHSPFTISIGISFSIGNKPYDTMFTEADTALYSAKGKGKNQYCIWKETKKSTCSCKDESEESGITT